MHTDVLLFHVRDFLPPRAPFGSRARAPNASNISPPPVIGYRYSWCHSHQRPWGKSLPIGCPGCSAIRSWSRSKRNSKGIHPEGRVTACLSCRYRCTRSPCKVHMRYGVTLTRVGSCIQWLFDLFRTSRCFRRPIPICFIHLILERRH